MEVLLVLRVELGPDDLFKAVGLGVNEFGVLRDRKVWVPSGGQRGDLSYRFQVKVFINVVQSFSLI